MSLWIPIRVSILFSIIDRGNDRMQHLALLTRFLILEDADGPADVREADVIEYIDRYQEDDGIGNETFESRPQAKNALRVMQAFFEVFKDDPMIAGGAGGLNELKTEYFIISIFLLLRHLLKHYVWDEPERDLFRKFTLAFYRRWSDAKLDDADIQIFSNKRQQTGGEIEGRHQITRQAFFEYAAQEGFELKTKDDRRAFNEAERILIYRRDNGRCQACVAEGRAGGRCDPRDR